MKVICKKCNKEIRYTKNGFSGYLLGKSFRNKKQKKNFYLL